MKQTESGLKRFIRRFLRFPAIDWVETLDDASTSVPLQTFRLFAVIGTWFEGDVIEATVRNAMTQGCDRVYVVDNGSPDDTVSVARKAGAIIAREFRTDGYDEPLRISIMNEVVESVSRDDGSDHIWWLWLDADEFPHGPGGRTLREYLAGLDARCRVAGARYFNHFPGSPPHYQPGRHPLDFQPLCEEFDATAFGHCRKHHWKHPLQRYDKSGLPIYSDTGFHHAKCREWPLCEPVMPMFVHHFPYRDRTVTTARLEMLCGSKATGESRNSMHDRRVGGASGIRKRFADLNAVYSGDWAGVDSLRAGGNSRGVRPRPWVECVCPADAVCRRWYAVETTVQDGSNGR